MEFWAARAKISKYHLTLKVESDDGVDRAPCWAVRRGIRRTRYEPSLCVLTSFIKPDFKHIRSLSN